MSGSPPDSAEAWLSVLLALLFVCVGCSGPHEVPLQSVASTHIPPSVVPETADFTTRTGTPPMAVSAAPTTSAIATEPPEPWVAYDADGSHPWNRLHRALFQRFDHTGREFGRVALDPYLWPRSLHLRTGPSQDEAVHALDALLSAPRDGPWQDPLRRALLQRDLWAVFDQLTTGGSAPLMPAIEERLAVAIRALALPRPTILGLPDSLALAVSTRAFPVAYDADRPATAYLPPDLLTLANGWICLGRRDGPAAIAHVANFPFYGRSVFLSCLRAPGGQEATERFLAALQSNPRLVSVPEGAEVALIRRAVLIDEDGEIQVSPIVESIQLRYLYANGGMRPFDLAVDRRQLFDGVRGGLAAVSHETEEFPLFRSHGLDVFEALGPATVRGSVHGVTPLETCRSCHIDKGMGITGAASILTVSRKRFPVPEGESTLVESTSLDAEAARTIAWKRGHRSWARLSSHWRPQDR